jgi:uncharacterized protein (TIGR00297 family)
MSAIHLLIGFGLALIIAGGGYLAGALSISGAVTAVLVGTFTFAGGGVVAATLMIFFFISSSALSRVGTARKRPLSADFAKGGHRDAGQVLANGILAALFSVGFGFLHGEIWLALLGGALAASTADTWATEVGVLGKEKPRLITSWQAVEPGTSGGVSVLGILASAGGAALLSLSGCIAGMGILPAATSLVGGVVGSLVDSLLGASVQAIYYCPHCAKETERHPYHICGSRTSLRRGWAWLNNDAVNFAATLAGALVSAALWATLRVL